MLLMAREVADAKVGDRRTARLGELRRRSRPAPSDAADPGLPTEDVALVSSQALDDLGGARLRLVSLEWPVRAVAQLMRQKLPDVC